MYNRHLWIFYELPNSTSVGKSLTQKSNDFHLFHGLKRRIFYDKCILYEENLFYNIDFQI